MSESVFELSKHTYTALTLVWAIFILLVSINCFLFGLLPSNETHSFQQSVLWSFGFWWKWAVVSPLVLPQIKLLSKASFHPRQFGILLPKALQFSLAAIVLATIQAALFGQHMSMEQWMVLISKKLFSDLYLGLVIYGAVLITGCLLLWTQKLSDSTTTTTKPRYLKHLLAAKGSGKAMVAVGDISHITAAGNYLEIHTASGTYLIRSTMKALQFQLNPNDFVRIHRSTLVAVSRIDTVSPRACGDYLLLLQCGTQVTVSKSYRNALKELAQPLRAA